MSPQTPNDPLHVFGVPLIGATPENGRRLLLTVSFIVIMLALGWLLRFAASALAGLAPRSRVAFWARQVVSLLTAALLLIGILSIWFDDPGRLATALGLVTAGLAFALQRVITATAGYFVILRGKTFNLGDRIVMGGVRGDVVTLSFMQTTIMEMGEPSGANAAGGWIHSRQYTGRLVTVSNAKVFDEPIYNFTRDFPYLWEEIALPVRYGTDGQAAERVIIDAVRTHTSALEAPGKEAMAELHRLYGYSDNSVEPRAYWRLTDNALEITVRYLTHIYGGRELKDAISRDILAGLASQQIPIAAPRIELVSSPYAYQSD